MRDGVRFRVRFGGPASPTAKVRSDTFCRFDSRHDRTKSHSSVYMRRTSTCPNISFYYFIFSLNKQDKITTMKRLLESRRIAFSSVMLHFSKLVFVILASTIVGGRSQNTGAIIIYSKCFAIVFNIDCRFLFLSSIQETDFLVHPLCSLCERSTYRRPRLLEWRRSAF